MRIDVQNIIAGTTIKTTMVSSGTTIDSGYSALISGSETLVSSMSLQDSGNGHYYALHNVPNVNAWYVNEQQFIADTNTYTGRQLLRATKLEVD